MHTRFPAKVLGSGKIDKKTNYPMPISEKKKDAIRQQALDTCRKYLKKDCKLSLHADDGEWAIYINGDL